MVILNSLLKLHLAFDVSYLICPFGNPVSWQVDFSAKTVSEIYKIE